MKKVLLIGLVPFLMVGCFKKVEEVDTLNDNIFDREYVGGKWFEITELLQYTNDLGQIRLKVRYDVPIENLPDLRSSIIDIAISRGSGEEKSWGYSQVSLNSDGGYSGDVDYVKNEENDYCLSLGITSFEGLDTVVINDFTECFSQ